MRRIQIKDAFKKLRIREKSESVAIFLKKIFLGVAHFLYRSRKMVLLVVAVAALTLIFSFLIAPWFNNGNGNGKDESADENNDRTISTVGTLHVEGLEIYGGDVTVQSGKVYIDWGELGLGETKNATFYVLSNSNVNVTLGLNVTDWTPVGLENYLSIYWDYNGTVLTPKHEALPVTASLNVPASNDFIKFLVDNSVTTFGFNITIYASGV